MEIVGQPLRLPFFVWQAVRLPYNVLSCLNLSQSLAQACRA
jgi:hypothetical protein